MKNKRPTKTQKRKYSKKRIGSIHRAEEMDENYLQRRVWAEKSAAKNANAWRNFGKPVPNEERHTRDSHSNTLDVTVQKDGFTMEGEG